MLRVLYDAKVLKETEVELSRGSESLSMRQMSWQSKAKQHLEVNNAKRDKGTLAAVLSMVSTRPLLYAVFGGIRVFSKSTKSKEDFL